MNEEIDFRDAVRFTTELGTNLLRVQKRSDLVRPSMPEVLPEDIPADGANSKEKV